MVLTCVAGLINGTLNIVPWGGPTARASSALQIDANEIFAPMVPALAAGLLVCFVFAYFLGISERRRLAKNGVAWVDEARSGTSDRSAPISSVPSPAQAQDPTQAQARDRVPPTVAPPRRRWPTATAIV